MGHSSFRAMPVCVGIGEACGTAAALAVKNGIKLRDVSPYGIQKLLKKVSENKKSFSDTFLSILFEKLFIIGRVIGL